MDRDVGMEPEPPPSLSVLDQKYYDALARLAQIELDYWTVCYHLGYRFVAS